ncbi:MULTISPECIES: ferredoxin-thioredoxin reductase variable chain [Oscillatoriales]|nr:MULTISPECIES: ferredoxin-thioredoxin reductase variable chain [Arthrospira]AMW31147.1 ferredoxin--nitrite reductase [Arthrospira platensis YZ]TVU55243.1 MAG: ferredoxin--nitrite reductase [Arthrospira sp. PLM2.Bin9]
MSLGGSTTIAATSVGIFTEIHEWEFMKVGDRVRVKESVIIYVNPEHRNQPSDAKGLEGEIVSILTDWNGRTITPNLPVIVQFNPKFKVHFREEELEVIEES